MKGEGAKMGKEIKYKLKYRENGEDKITNIKLDFFSIGIARDIDELSAKQFDVSEKWKTLIGMGQKMVQLKADKPDGYKEEVKALKSESDDLKIEIVSYGNDVYLSDQYELIQKILKDNKVTDGVLMNKDFWENCVDVEEIGNFLHAVSHKDDYLKKKPETAT